jgi:alpha-L-arabinofuranosidase
MHAQLVNNIHTSFLADGDRFTVTPVFNVFEMYAEHHGGTSVRTVFSAPAFTDKSVNGLWGLRRSCSLHGKRPVLTVLNPDAQNACETEIDFREHPQAIEPVKEKITGSGSPMMYRFAAASVRRLEFDLS